MLKIATISAFITASLFAGEGHTDIIERTINFSIFLAILYYLIAEPLKKFLSDRTLSIESEFKRNEAKLEESKKAKDKMKEEVISAKRRAGIIIADAKKEAELIKSKLEETYKHDLVLLEKQQVELIELQERKMVQSVVAEVMKDVLKGDISLDSQSISNLLVRKVS
jgi:F-type H+-transporting ATPase subunit b